MRHFWIGRDKRKYLLFCLSQKQISIFILQKESNKKQDLIDLVFYFVFVLYLFF